MHSAYFTIYIYILMILIPYYVYYYYIQQVFENKDIYE